MPEGPNRHRLPKIDPKKNRVMQGVPTGQLQNPSSRRKPTQGKRKPGVVGRVIRGAMKKLGIKKRP